MWHTPYLAEGPHSPELLSQPDEDSQLLPLLVCLRFLFVPLFMLCHVPQRSRLPIIFWQDAYFITFMLLFAVSNGYLVSLTMCLAPRSGKQRVGGWAWGGPSSLRGMWKGRLLTLGSCSGAILWDRPSL